VAGRQLEQFFDAKNNKEDFKVIKGSRIAGKEATN